MLQRLGSKLVTHNNEVLHTYLESLDRRISEIAAPTIVLDPKDFGAIGDGVTDDTDAIEKCILAAQATGKGVLVSRGKTYLTRGVNVREGVVVMSDGTGGFKKKDASTGDFISLGHRAALYRVRVDGNKANQQLEPANALVRIGDCDDVSIIECDIRGANSYGIVINTGSRALVRKNKVADVYHAALAVYSNVAEKFHVIEENTFQELGWGALNMQYAMRCVVRRNRCLGTFLGNRSKRQYVDSHGDNRVTLRAGDLFTSLRAGNWLVIQGGAEYRITQVVDSTTILVDRNIPAAQGHAALTGTGDLMGFQSVWHCDVDDNYMANTTTFGFGGGTTGGNTSAMHYCRFRNNIVENTGKNGFNLGQMGKQGIGNCYILHNTLRNVGGGGDAVSEVDKAAFVLHFGDAGYMSNIVVDGNTAESYGGDDGQTHVWLRLTGTPTIASVLLGENWAIGLQQQYILGDIISITISGWGTESKFTDYASYGRSCRVTISTAGTGQLPNPWCQVNKACVPQANPMVFAQMATSNVGLMSVWGTQLSSPGIWKFYASGTPAGGGLMDFNLIGG